MSEQQENTEISPTSPASDPVASLREELIRERFEAVALKAGLDETVVDLVAPAAHRWLQENNREATKEALAEFMTDLKKNKPRLFASAPSSAPANVHAQRVANTTAPPGPPSTPAPSSLQSAFAHWQALRAAGRMAEAEAFFRMNRNAIHRTSG